MPLVISFIVGALFAVGLGLSGMTQPERVIGFLDFFGSWDGTLMFVMAGAVVMYFVFYRVVRGSAPILTQHFQIPTRRQIDARLVVGAGMFGAGWGLAGFCPGPALVSLGHGAREALVFGAAMIGGMYLFAGYDRLVAWTRSRPEADRAREPSGSGTRAAFSIASSD